jgi:uncharacterized RDD family membrane protein YckC
MTENKAGFPAYAGFWRRLCSILIDTAIAIPLISLSYWIPLNKWAAILLCPFFYLQSFFYNILFLRYFGQTPGMMAMRFKVVRLDLSPLRWREAFLRYSVDAFIASLSAILMICAFLKASPDSFGAAFERIQDYFDHLNGHSNVFSRFWSDAALCWTLSEVVVLLFNEKKRAIHDFIAGTVVVRVDNRREVIMGRKRVFSNFSKEWNVLFATGLVLFMLLLLFERTIENYNRNKMNEMELGVIKGEAFLSSNVLVKGAWVDHIQDIVSDPSGSSSFWILGRNFISLIQNDGKVLKTVRLSKGISSGDFVLKSGSTNFSAFRGWITHFSLVGADGEEIWTAPYSRSAVCWAAGKILGDSQTQFVVGYKDGILQLLDSNGQLIWQKSGERLSDVETGDIQGNGRDEIVEISQSGKWMIRDASGNPVTEYSSPVSVKGFSIIQNPWPNKGGASVALFPDKRKYMFFNLGTGAPITEWGSEFDLSLDRGQSRAVWTNWNSKKEKSLAVLTAMRSGMSILNVFDEAGNIQFCELIEGDCKALAVVKSPIPGSHALLCGVDGKIVEYQRKQ